MKIKNLKTYFAFLWIFLTTNLCTAQTENYFKDYTFESIQVQADSIHQFVVKAMSEKTENKDKWERKFFCAFPSSYAVMDSIFGFNEKPAPLYHSKIPRKVKSYVNSDSHIGFFSQLTSIPANIYYNKYVNICIDGYWQADKIRAGFGFGLHLFYNPKPSCIALAKKSDSEIKSVFRFIFDGPHPGNKQNRHFYKILLPVVKAENERLSKLLTVAFNKLMKESNQY